MKEHLYALHDVNASCANVLVDIASVQQAQDIFRSTRQAMRIIIHNACITKTHLRHKGKIVIKNNSNSITRSRRIERRWPIALHPMQPLISVITDEPMGRLSWR